ncbi:LLM class flavin-dependent oxidoreductase [Streptomyces sp. NRRL B-24085]|uniref:LLM class flavin-dependent oxidoreductase n=1 Tax=Streptomyces sp. NRRL B-24085 TaxID=1709476 RepID=UPI0006B3227E|nr:LLM class flavin-dependent oxidoreductase [Streptomyces sp. NRRL B-24085]
MSESPASPARGRVGVMLPLDLPVGEVLPYVRRAEELGFDEIWVVEDLGRRGGVAQAATVLAATTNLTVGIGIMPAGARNAAFAAMELATLAQLHPGRLMAGIGHGMPGWMRQVGSWPESPLTLIKEYARALRLLIAGEPGPENGRYVRCVSGTPAQARAAIDARHAAGATSVVLTPAGPDRLAALDSLARALPHRPCPEHPDTPRERTP